MPKNILPNIAFSHRTGIESLSSFKVSINFCISFEEKILSNVGRGTWILLFAGGLGCERSNNA